MVCRCDNGVGAKNVGAAGYGAEVAFVDLCMLIWRWGWGKGKGTTYHSIDVENQWMSPTT
jgi:hypothetical protein